jgi:RNA polymerase sigma factor (sigma-70 family)
MNVVEQLTEMYEDKYDDLVRIYKSRAGANDVEDLVQEAFYRAIKYKDSYKPNLVTIETWMAGILQNCLKDLLREKRDGASMHNELKEDSCTYTMPVDSHGFKSILLKEIEKKSMRNRNVLFFHFIMGYPHKLIDHIVGTTSSRVLVSQFKVEMKQLYPEYVEHKDLED